MKAVCLSRLSRNHRIADAERRANDAGAVGTAAGLKVKGWKANTVMARNVRASVAEVTKARYRLT
jgi:hypothetical protein